VQRGEARVVGGVAVAKPGHRLDEVRAERGARAGGGGVQEGTAVLVRGVDGVGEVRQELLHLVRGPLAGAPQQPIRHRRRERHGRSRREDAS
jgi:hypothetical protein